MNNLVQIIPNWLIISYIFLTGICVGSFLNVVVLRGLSGEDIIFDRSRCPKCKNQLKWYMNIPLLSYIFLRGKCAFCKTHISFQYPIVEALSGLLFVFSYIHFGFTLKTLYVFVVISLFIVLATTDFIETVILDYHAYILTTVGLIGAIFKLGNITIIQSLIGAVVGFFGFEIVSRFILLFLKQRAFGEGDSYIALAIGAVFGLKQLILIVLLSLVVQSLVAIPVLVLKCFRERKIQLGISYLLILFVMAIIIVFNLLLNTSFEKYYVYIAIISCLILLHSLINIVKEIREKREKFEKILEEKKDEITKDNEEDFKFENSTYFLMPFGPALIISSLIMLFFHSNIIMLIKKFLY